MQFLTAKQTVKERMANSEDIEHRSQTTWANNMHIQICDNNTTRTIGVSNDPQKKVYNVCRVCLKTAYVCQEHRGGLYSVLFLVSSLRMYL